LPTDAACQGVEQYSAFARGLAKPAGGR